MPRKKQHTGKSISKDAMWQFWNHGYASTSMDDLVRVTGASRHAIYSDTGGKRDLFITCLKAYNDQIVSPAFCKVEAENADLESIEDYFSYQISKAEKIGAPYPGCLMANTMTENSPHDDDVLQLVQSHNERLKSGFLSALKNCNQAKLSDDELLELAEFIATSAQGLWSFSRTLTNVDPLIAYKKTLMQLIKERIKS